jgi:hypothetical protein
MRAPGTEFSSITGIRMNSSIRSCTSCRIQGLSRTRPTNVADRYHLTKQFVKCLSERVTRRHLDCFTPRIPLALTTVARYVSH